MCQNHRMSRQLCYTHVKSIVRNPENRTSNREMFTAVMKYCASVKC